MKKISMVLAAAAFFSLAGCSVFDNEIVAVDNNYELQGSFYDSPYYLCNAFDLTLINGVSGTYKIDYHIENEKGEVISELLRDSDGQEIISGGSMELQQGVRNTLKVPRLKSGLTYSLVLSSEYKGIVNRYVFDIPENDHDIISFFTSARQDYPSSLMSINTTVMDPSVEYTAQFILDGTPLNEPEDRKNLVVHCGTLASSNSELKFTFTSKQMIFTLPLFSPGEHNLVVRLITDGGEITSPQMTFIEPYRDKTALTISWNDYSKCFELLVNSERSIEFSGTFEGKAEGKRQRRRQSLDEYCETVTSESQFGQSEGFSFQTPTSKKQTDNGLSYSLIEGITAQPTDYTYDGLTRAGSAGHRVTNLTINLNLHSKTGKEPVTITSVPTSVSYTSKYHIVAYYRYKPYGYYDAYWTFRTCEPENKIYLKSDFKETHPDNWDTTKTDWWAPYWGKFTFTINGQAPETITEL